MKELQWVPKISTENANMKEDCAEVFNRILHKYFKRAYSHVKGSEEPYTANFMTKVRWPNYKSTINIEGPHPHSLFYDKEVDGGGCFSESVESAYIRIQYNSGLAGFYNPETQHLVATDWTHIPTNRAAITMIIETLVEKGLLTEIEQAIEKEPECPKFEITLGCDPEFELILHGNVVHAGSYFENDHINNRYGNVGLDGTSDQIELRPNPSSDPKKVVDNIRNLLEGFASSAARFRLAASSDYYPCGGHIHVGFNPMPSEDFFTTIVEIYDNFIGELTNKLNGSVRQRCSYSRIGAWRRQSHGIEYRTPPSAVFRNPELSEIVFKLAANIADRLANNKKVIYNYPVTKQDLVEVGGLTEEESEKYLLECNRPFPRKNECLLAAWGIEVPPETVSSTHINIDFADEWHEAMQQFVLKHMKTVKVDREIYATFYGLKEERGDHIYTFTCPFGDYCWIEHPNERYEYDSIPAFGFPYAFRMGRISGSEAGKMLDRVIQLILE